MSAYNKEDMVRNEETFLTRDAREKRKTNYVKENKELREVSTVNRR